MSGKMGTRETGRKPVTTRHHDSQADGAFGRENVDELRSSPEETNVKVSGAPPKQHSKHTEKDRS